MTNAISHMENTLDVRDIIARVEELQDLRENLELSENDEEAEKEVKAFDASEEGEELKTLSSLLDDMKGGGGDEQWRGDWYPGTLIRDSYFEEYAQEIAHECGDMKSDARWPYTCIDWEKAASELQGDYSSVEYDGVTYWYR